MDYIDIDPIQDVICDSIAEVDGGSKACMYTATLIEKRVVMTLYDDV